MILECSISLRNRENWLLEVLERTSEESIKAVTKPPDGDGWLALSTARAAVYEGGRDFSLSEVSVDSFPGYLPSSTSACETIEGAANEIRVIDSRRTTTTEKAKKEVRFVAEIKLFEIYEKVDNKLIRNEEERLWLLLNIISPDQIFKKTLSSALYKRTYNRILITAHYLAVDLEKLYFLGEEGARAAKRIFLNNPELVNFNPSLCVSCFRLLLDSYIYYTGEPPINYFEKNTFLSNRKFLFEELGQGVNALPSELLDAYRTKLLEEGIIQLDKAGTADSRRLAFTLAKHNRSLYFYNKAFFINKPEFAPFIADYLYCDTPSTPEFKIRRHYLIWHLLNSSDLTSSTIDRDRLRAQVVILVNDIMELKDRDYEATFSFYKFSKIFAVLPEILEMLLKNKSFLSWAGSDIINYCLSSFIEKPKDFIGNPTHLVVRKTIGRISVVPSFPDDFLIAFEIAYPCLWYISLIERAPPYFQKVAVKIIKSISYNKIDFSKFGLGQINNLLRLLEGVTEVRCLAFKKILNNSLNIYCFEETLNETEEANIHSNAELLIDQANTLVLSNIREAKQRGLVESIFDNLVRIFGNEVLYTASNRVLGIHPFFREHITPGVMPSLKCMRIVLAETFSPGYSDHSLITIAATIMKGLSRSFYHAVII